MSDDMVDKKLKLTSPMILSLLPDVDTRLVGLVDFQQPPSAKKAPTRQVKRRVKKVINNNKQ